MIATLDCRIEGRACVPSERESAKSRVSINPALKKEGTYLVPPLLGALKTELSRMAPDTKPVLLLVASRTLPYRIIAEVVHTAGVAGIHDFRFAIVMKHVRSRSNDERKFEAPSAVGDLPDSE